MQNGNVSDNDVLPNGEVERLPPAGNTGGNSPSVQGGSGHRMGTDRLRINISVPDGIYDALAGAASKTGMSVSQVALQALLAGLPALALQVEAVEGLRS